MAPVWIPPVTVKLEAKAALPAGLFERAETGARPLRTARFCAVCASAQAAPIIRATRPIPHPSLFMAPLLLWLACLVLCRAIFCAIKTASNNGQAIRH